MVDAGKSVGVHLAVLISWYRFGHAGEPALLLVPVGFAAVASVTYFGMIMADQFRLRAGAATTTARPTPAVPRMLGAAAVPDGSLRKLRSPAWRKLAAIPTDYGVLCLALVLVPATTAFTVTYTVIFVVSTAFLGSCLIGWRHEVSRMDSLDVTA